MYPTLNSPELPSVVLLLKRDWVVAVSLQHRHLCKI